jgi:hypothetical protein
VVSEKGMQLCEKLRKGYWPGGESLNKLEKTG